MPSKLPGEGQEWTAPLMPHQQGGRRPDPARPATPPWVDPTPPWADQPSESPTRQTSGNGQESGTSDLPDWLAESRNRRRDSDVSTVSGLGSPTGERGGLEYPLSDLPDWLVESRNRRRDSDVSTVSGLEVEEAPGDTRRNSTAHTGQLPSNPLRGVRDTQRAAFGPGSPNRAARHTAPEPHPPRRPAHHGGPGTPAPPRPGGTRTLTGLHPPPVAAPEPHEGPR